MALLNVRSPLTTGKGPREITQSALNTFGLCRRRFHWNVNERLDPLRQTKAINFGHLWHRIMAAHYLRMADLQMATCDDNAGMWFPTSAEKVLHDAQREAARYYEEARTADVDMDQVNEDLDLAGTMYSQFCTVFDPDIDMNTWWIRGVECTLRGRIPTLNGKPSAWTMVGTLDLLLQCKKTGRIVVVDHKSTSTDRDRHVPNLDLSFQGQDYVWLASLACGLPVNHVVFQGARRKAPTIPEPLKSTGLLSDADSKVPDTTLTIFDAAARKCVEDVLSEPPPDLGPEPSDAKEAKAWKKKLETATEKYNARRTEVMAMDICVVYANARRALAAREDNNGNSFVWRKEAYIPQDRIDRFRDDVYRKCLDIADERRWNTSLDACNSIGRSCPYIALCVYGDGPMSRMAFKERVNFLPSLKRDIEEENK